MQRRFVAGLCGILPELHSGKKQTEPENCDLSQFSGSVFLYSVLL